MSFARVRALVVITALTLAAIIFVVIAMVRDSQSGGPATSGCPDNYVVADLRLPEPKDVKIRVYNGSGVSGQGKQVATDFRNRRFQVDKQITDWPKTIEGVAVLRYGPEAVGSSHLLQAYFLTEASPEYDSKRKGRTVDVIIGIQFQQLGTTTEVNQAIGALGSPPLPTGACAAKS